MGRFERCRCAPLRALLSAGLSVALSAGLSAGALAQSVHAPAVHRESVGRQVDQGVDAGIPMPGHTLGKLAHLPGGEWRTSLGNERGQRDIWFWGPSKHALISVTTNSEATGESIFGSFRVIYHHPQRDELCVLVLDSRELIQTGTLVVNNDGTFHFDMTVFYDQEKIPWASMPRREIESVWTFKTPSTYSNSWIRDMGRPVEPGLVAWTYTRHAEIQPLPANAGDPPGEVVYLGAFLPLTESAWESDTWRTTFRWVPYNESIRMRTVEKVNGQLVREAVIYPHPITKRIHVVVVHASGAIDEGVVSVVDGAIRVRGTRSDHDGTTQIDQHIERPTDGVLRITTWSITESARERIDQTVYRGSEE